MSRTWSFPPSRGYSLGSRHGIGSMRTARRDMGRARRGPLRVSPELRVLQRGSGSEHTAGPHGAVRPWDARARRRTRRYGHARVSRAACLPGQPSGWGPRRLPAAQSFRGLAGAPGRGRAETRGSRPRRLDVHHDLPPLALPEPRDAEARTREVAEHDGEPDVGGLQAAGLLEQEAQAERHDDLRDDRDVERAARVAAALEPARVRERDGDEEPGYAQVPHELHAD